MANYTEENLYLPAGESLFDKYFLALSIALPVCVVFGFVFGLLGLCKCSYKVVALMATGVVIKLALIPDVEDDLVEEKQPEGTNAEGNSDTQSNNDPQTTAHNETQDHSSQNGTVDETETRTQHNTSSVRQSLIDNVNLFKHKDVDKVVFTTGRDSSGEPYLVRPFAPVLLIPLAAFLIAAYASVIITAQWTITTKCPIAGTDNDSSICYSGLHNPPVDCAAWKNVGMQAELICVANSTAFDPFNPLERFVSLLAVQVAVLQFFACIINKGCCNIKCREVCRIKCRDPPIRYSVICGLDLVFVLLVSLTTALLWRAQTESDSKDTFEKLIIPFIHLIAVSLAECLILFVFTCLLCCEECCKCLMSKCRRHNDPTPTPTERQQNEHLSNTDESLTTDGTGEPQPDAMQTHHSGSGDDNDNPSSLHPRLPPEPSLTPTGDLEPIASEGTDN